MDLLGEVQWCKLELRVVGVGGGSMTMRLRAGPIARASVQEEADAEGG